MMHWGQMWALRGPSAGSHPAELSDQSFPHGSSEDEVEHAPRACYQATPHWFSPKTL